MAEIDESKVKQEEKQPPVVEEKKPDNKADEENTRLKAALSRANSEAAEWKRKYSATLDEAKRKELEAEEIRKQELAELEELRKDKRINSYKAKLMEAGIDGAAADLMAKALPDGVAEEYFTATKTFISNQRQAFQTETLKNQPGLSVGLPPTTADARKEELNRMRSAFGLPLK